MITRRVYVSLPADPWLPRNLNDLKWGIVDEICKLGYTPEIFSNPRGMPGLASPRGWHPRDADEIARRCVGAAVIGMARWRFDDGQGNPVLLPTEFNHYEGALARTLALPTLVLVQSNVRRRVVFDMSYGGYVGEFRPDADVSWLHCDEFKVPFKYWRDQLDDRRDIFLGYCSKSSGVAQAIKRILQSIGATVLDWQTDFIPGQTILEQIANAATRCLAGVFLFTTDDDLAEAGPAYSAVPRDNVVFEAGYFVGRKSKRNVLIIRERGCKMPADLGGDIYASLDDRSNLDAIEKTLKAFIGAM